MRTPTAQVKWQRRASVSGFTLIEIMIALVISGICLLGLASSTITALQLVKLSDVETERGLARQELIETIRSTDFDSIGFASDSVGDYQVWYWSTVVVDDPDAKNVFVVTRGPGRVRGSLRAYSGQVSDTMAVLVTRATS